MCSFALVGCAGEAEQAPTPPVPKPRPSPPGFTVGINAGQAAAYEARVGSRLHPSVVRVDFDISSPVSKIAPTVAALAARGERVQLLASFIGRMPGSSEARNLGRWAHAFGPRGSFWRGRSDGRLAVRYIEFGNETNQSYQYDDCGPGCPGYPRRAREYAVRFKEAQEAIAGADGNHRVGLLAISDDSGSSTWADNMYDAVPDLTSRVAGWIEHPYGPDYRTKTNNLLAGVAPHGGGKLPLFITEYGIATDNGRCLNDNYGWPRCLTYQQAADDLRGAIAGLRETYGSQLAEIMIFAQIDGKPSGATDNREDYFGALQSGGQDKGAFTAAVTDELRAHRG